MGGLTPEQALKSEQLVEQIGMLCRQMVTCARLVHEAMLRPETIPDSNQLAELAAADLRDIANAAEEMTRSKGMTGVVHYDAMACLMATANAVNRLADNVLGDRGEPA